MSPLTIAEKTVASGISLTRGPLVYTLKMKVEAKVSALNPQPAIS